MVEAETKDESLLACQREELKFKMEQKAEFSKPQNTTPALTSNEQSGKLPKLLLTKYNGALENWLAFWNKFEVEINSQDLPGVTKFAYLKELEETHVQKGIDGLPFTTEEYEPAKNILKTNYGKISEIIKPNYQLFREYSGEKFTTSTIHCCKMYSRLKP